MALKDTLVRLRRQQEDAASYEAEKPRLRDEWVEAVASLIDEFKRFLAPFEADGSLAFIERTVSLTEDDLGTYDAPAATIGAGSAKIELTPVGRIVAGATGRVDLSRQGYSSAGDRILVLRFHDEDLDTSRWVLRMSEGWEGSRLGSRWEPATYDFFPLDQSNVEKAIDFLLSLGGD